MSLLASIPFFQKSLRAPRQVVSASWADRSQILDRDVNLFCWKRNRQEVIDQYLGRLVQNPLEPIVFTSFPHELSEKISEYRSKWDAEQVADADPFWEDVYQLADDFIATAGAKQATLHLRVIDNNACSKFHVDGYSLRLFTSYIGQGTEWLPESATNRDGLGKTNELIVKEAAAVRQMDAQEVGILKGEVPNERRYVKGIVHRSPPIEATGSKRIILRVDI